MFKSKFLNFFSAVLTLSTLLWFATPNTLITSFKSHAPFFNSIGNESDVNSNTKNSEELVKPRKPAYFSIFKFIYDIIPNRQPQSNISSEIQLTADQASFA